MSNRNTVFVSDIRPFLGGVLSLFPYIFCISDQIKTLIINQVVISDRGKTGNLCLSQDVSTFNRNHSLKILLGGHHEKHLMSDIRC